MWALGLADILGPRWAEWEEGRRQDYWTVPASLHFMMLVLLVLSVNVFSLHHQSAYPELGRGHFMACLFFCRRCSTGILFPLILCQVCPCCVVNFYCVFLCEYVQSLTRRVIFEFRNNCIFCKMKGSPTASLTMTVASVSGKNTGKEACTGKPFVLQESTFLVRGYNGFYSYQWLVIFVSTECVWIYL